MKVALINDYQANTGAGNYAFSLFHEMKKSIDVEMLYLESVDRAPAEEKIKGLPGFKFPFLNRTLNSIYYYPGKLPKDYDIHHVANQFLSLVSLNQKHNIVSCLDIIPLVLKQDYPWLLRFFLTKAMKKINQAEKIITISDFSKQELMRVFNVPEEKIQTVYLGFDQAFQPRKKEAAREQLGLPGEKKIILHVGSEEPRKNLPTVLKALRQVKKNVPEINFIRIGEQRPETRKLIEKLGLQENVKYYLKAPLEKTALFYNAADLVVFPSSYEGFGLPALEAMASGSPLITTKSSSLLEVCQEAAAYAQTFDAGDWAEQIKRVLHSNQLSQELSRKGLKQSQNFSWQKTAQETIKIYEEVLS